MRFPPPIFMNAKRFQQSMDILMSKNRDGMNSNPESCRTPCAECKNDYKQDDLPDVDLVPEHSRIVNYNFRVLRTLNLPVLQLLSRS